MALFKNGIDLFDNLKAFIDTSTSLFIYAPYIKLETLKALIDRSVKVEAVIVRWEVKDLLQGSSDLDVFPFLLEKGIVLYRNPRLHLKAYLDNRLSCFVTTANISSRALNVPQNANFNYELGITVSNLTFQDQLYFNNIETDSVLITENIFRQIEAQLKKLDRSNLDPPEFSFEFGLHDKDFLISSLPMSEDINSLYLVYHNQSQRDEVEVNCALHDLALYKIPFGLSYDAFMIHLSSSFFSHPFIKAFINYLTLEKQLFFGQVKDWIQKNCSDVPTPRKWEITRNIQILYNWIIALGGNKYSLDRPNYSERIFLT